MIYYGTDARLMTPLQVHYKGGSVAGWVKALVLKPGDPGFKASTLPLAGFVSGTLEFKIFAHAL